MKPVRSCDNCKRDCSFATGYDHAPFEAHFFRVDAKTFVCISWADKPDAPIETERMIRRPA